MFRTIATRSTSRRVFPALSLVAVLVAAAATSGHLSMSTHAQDDDNPIMYMWPPDPEYCKSVGEAAVESDDDVAGVLTTCLIWELQLSSEPVDVAVNLNANLLCIQSRLEDVAGVSCIDADTSEPGTLITTAEGGSPVLIAGVDPSGRLAYLEVDGVKYSAFHPSGYDKVSIAYAILPSVPENLVFYDDQSTAFAEDAPAAYQEEVDREFAEAAAGPEESGAVDE